MFHLGSAFKVPHFETLGSSWHGIMRGGLVLGVLSRESISGLSVVRWSLCSSLGLGVQGWGVIRSRHVDNDLCLIWVFTCGLFSEFPNSFCSSLL